MENNLTLLEEKAEKDLAAMCREKEKLQGQVLELRRQLLLQQKHEELAAALDAQVGLSVLLKPEAHERESKGQGVTTCILPTLLRLLMLVWTPVSATQCAESLVPASSDGRKISCCRIQGRS